MVRNAAKLAVLVLGISLSVRAGLAEPPVAPAPAPNAPAPPSGPSPHIKFDKTDANLGEIVRGKEAVATFTYHNTGEVPLHIISVKPG